MVNESRPQSPFESITKEQYENAKNKTTGTYENDCNNGVCPIKWNKRKRKMKK